jgi:hypothetical protein
MPDLDEIGRWTTGQLPALIAKYTVLGAASGVYRSGEVFDFAVGVRGHVGKAEATADSVFQIDPIIKNWTVGLAARLADTGLLDIDQPVALSAESTVTMRSERPEVPPLSLAGTHRGLGFELFIFPGGSVFGHDGDTIGQSAFPRSVPGKDPAIALLTNGGSPSGPYLGVYADSVGKSIATQDSDGRIRTTDEPLGEVDRNGSVHRERDTPTPLEPEYGIPRAADIHRRRRRRRAIPLLPQRPGPPARRLTPSGRDL